MSLIEILFGSGILLICVEKSDDIASLMLQIWMFGCDAIEKTINGYIERELSTSTRCITNVSETAKHSMALSFFFKAHSFIKFAFKHFSCNSETRLTASIRVPYSDR